MECSVEEFFFLLRMKTTPNDKADGLRFKRATFRALHEQGCFVLPNPWDVGGIRRLEKLGFKALSFCLGSTIRRGTFNTLVPSAAVILDGQ